MPTVRTVTVKSSGGDYTSLEAARAGEASLHASLVSADIQLNIVLFAMTDTATLGNWNVFTTDATRYIDIYADSSAAQNGVWDSSGSKYTLSGSAGIVNMRTYCRVHGFQIAVTNTLGALGINGTAIGVVFYNLLIYVSADSSHTATGIYSPTTTAYFYNCIVIILAGSSASRCMYVNNLCVVYSCIAINPFGLVSISRLGGTVLVKNCYASATSLAYQNCTLTTCASSDSSSGSVGLRGIAYSTANFTNVTPGAEDFHLPTGSALIGVGTDTSGDAAPMNFTNDIAGLTRTAPWDVGAFKYNPATGLYTRRGMTARVGSRF